MSYNHSINMRTQRRPYRPCYSLGCQALITNHSLPLWNMRKSRTNIVHGHTLSNTHGGPKIKSISKASHMVEPTDGPTNRQTDRRMHWQTSKKSIIVSQKDGRSNGWTNSWNNRRTDKSLINKTSLTGGTISTAVCCFLHCRELPYLLSPPLPSQFFPTSRTPKKVFLVPTLVGEIPWLIWWLWLRINNSHA